ncbi:MAG: hypothetical protein KGH52_03335 [Candidatus Micrarchaeota archaeon]|nr:hypothetical protein [Candidatus Micrarchaeota archaeon]
MNRLNREIPRVIGDAVVFFALFELIFLSIPSQISAGSYSAAALGATTLITIQALFGLYVERAVFYYVVRPGSLRTASRWVAKGAVLYTVNAVLFGILIALAPSKPPVGGGVLAAFVLFAALVFLIVQAIGDYIVFRIMAATARRAR